MTNVRPVVFATLALGTSSDGAVRRTGQRTWQNVPGASRPSALLTSSSTAIVLLPTSTDWEIRATVPANVWPGYAATVNDNDVPLRDACGVRLGNRDHEPQSIALDDADDRRRRPRSTGRADQGSGMHIAFGHDAGERRGDPEVRLPCR